MSYNRGRSRSSILFSLALATLLALAACSSGGSSDSNVQVTSTTVEPQGKLSLHATATFEVSIKDPSGLYQAANLEYHWSLDQQRGTYLPDGADEATEVVTASSSLLLRGDTSGSEVVRVTVVDTSTDTTVGVGTLAFEITSPSSTSSCYKTPTLFIRHGQPFDVTETIDLETGERGVYGYYYVSDVSDDGNWVTGLTSFSQNKQVYVQRCDGTVFKTLTDGTLYVETPAFSPDGQYVYFKQRSPDENPLNPNNPAYMELAVVNVATGVTTVLSDFNAKAESLKSFAISPDGETIILEHFKASKVDGLYVADYTLVSMPAGGGPLHTMTKLGDYNPLYGITFSPDGSDILFSWAADKQTEDFGEAGLYRIHPTAGSGPQLILADLSPVSTPPRNPRYYGGGTRIIFKELLPGELEPVIVSVDANGDDFQRMVDVGKLDHIADVWDPH